MRNCGCSIRNCKAPGHARRGSDARRGWSGAAPNLSVATGAGFGEVHGGKHDLVGGLTRSGHGQGRLPSSSPRLRPPRPS